jgi:hypothetical protein
MSSGFVSHDSRELEERWAIRTYACRCSPGDGVVKFQKRNKIAGSVREQNSHQSGLRKIKAHR